MRRTGIIHAELARALAALRHTDTLVISDSGLPVPAGPAVIDLGVVYGMSPFAVVLDAILAEVVVEAATVSEPVVTQNPGCWKLLQDRLPALERIPHEEFKAQVGHARFVVRTGEATPYANVLLRAGVPFLD